MRGVIGSPRIVTKRGRTDCAGGCRAGVPRSHHSGEEADYCNTLELLQKAGEIRSYRTQVRYQLHNKEGRGAGYMCVDFEVVRADGRVEIHEYKGKNFESMPEFVRGRALFSWCYPHLQYHTIKKGQRVI